MLIEWGGGLMVYASVWDRFGTGDVFEVSLGWVVDGDSIRACCIGTGIYEIRDLRFEIRLFGADAPEWGQRGYVEASAYLWHLTR